MRLEERFSVDIEAISPYSFELTLGKPAGWWWSTPEEECRNPSITELLITYKEIFETK